MNAGTNTFTNITIKSILKFHPNAKVFVFDVPKTDEENFTLIDDDVKGSVEVIKGILWGDLNLPTIDVNKAGNLTDIERKQIIDRYHSDKIEVLPNGDFQHPMNIQFAIDTLDENFILMFTVRNEAGALAQALNIIGAHGYNMRSLRSRPMKNLQWNYYFYIEAEGNICNEDGNNMLRELSAVCARLRLVGTFHTGMAGIGDEP